MEKKLFIITNESIYPKNNEVFFCDNIDLKSIPEGLNNYTEINVIGRLSKKQRSKKIELKNVYTCKNIFGYLFFIFQKIIREDAKYLIISLSPYTFLASLLLKLFSKTHYIYLRSDGYEEYKAIFGNLGKFIYHLIFTFSSIKAKLIACRRHLLRNKLGEIVSPSQLNDKWITNHKKINLKKIKLLYVGRLRVEKGIFSLIKMLQSSALNLTIVTSEKNRKLRDISKNINLISFENYNDEIIKFYDEHNIFVLPSFTEAHPQVLDEALARLRPVIIFKEIEHVKRNREGVFICERNLESLEKKISFIIKDYPQIVDKIKTNILPTKKSFINQLKKIILE